MSSSSATLTRPGDPSGGRPARRRPPRRHMRKVSLRNLAAHKVRLALTVLSVVLGTAFVAGSFVFTDTLQRTFNGIFDDTAVGVDVRVAARDDNSSGVPLADLDRLRAVPGVTKVEPGITGQIVLLGSDGKAVKGGGAPSLGLSYLPPEQQIGDQYTFIAGWPPTRPGEIALNPGAARLGKLSSASHTQVLVPSKGMLDVTLTGIYATKTETGGYIGALFAPGPGAAAVHRRQARGLRRHAVMPATGVSQSELRDRVAQALPELQAKTGEQVRQRRQAGHRQRPEVHQLLPARLRCDRAAGRHVHHLQHLLDDRGAAGARAGAAAGDRRQPAPGQPLGAAGGWPGRPGRQHPRHRRRRRPGLRAAGAARTASTSACRPAPCSCSRAPMLVALVIGVGVTLFSAYSPARRAAKIAPVAAMREEFASTGTSLRLRTAIGLAASPARRAGPGRRRRRRGRAAARPGWSASARCCLILGVLLGAPALSRPVIGVVGTGLGPVVRHGGPAGPDQRGTQSPAYRGDRLRADPGPDAGDHHRGVRRVGQEEHQRPDRQRRHRRLHPDRPGRGRRAGRRRRRRRPRSTGWPPRWRCTRCRCEIDGQHRVGTGVDGRSPTCCATGSCSGSADLDRPQPAGVAEAGPRQPLERRQHGADADRGPGHRSTTDDRRHLRRQPAAGQLAGLRRLLPRADPEPAAVRRGGAGQGRAGHRPGGAAHRAGAGHRPAGGGAGAGPRGVQGQPGQARSTPCWRCSTGCWRWPS